MGSLISGNILAKNFAFALTVTVMAFERNDYKPVVGRLSTCGVIFRPTARHLDPFSLSLARAITAETIVPCLDIMLAAWGFNAMGDAIRDILDPRMLNRVRGGRTR